MRLTIIGFALMLLAAIIAAVISQFDPPQEVFLIPIVLLFIGIVFKLVGLYVDPHKSILFPKNKGEIDLEKYLKQYESQNQND